MQKGDTISVLDKGFVRYISHTPEELVLEFARICYNSASKGDEQDQKLINYLWKNKHTSPFEAPKIYFNVKMPIFVMRQWVRHRMQNLNEVSARYTELPDEFYIPSEWRKQDTKNRQSSLEFEKNWNPSVVAGCCEDEATNLLETHCYAAYALYEGMLRAGIAREMARMVLPLNIYTEIYCCWDLKNLLHFIALREDSHAQSEIRDYAVAMKSFLVQAYPKIMYAYERFKFEVKDMEETPITQ